MQTKKNPFLPTILVNSLRLHGDLAITLSCGLAALVSSQSAFAAPRVWSGTSGVDWSTGGLGGNWTGLAAPVAADTLTFAGTTNTTTNNNIAANTSFGTISFTNTVNGQSFSLGGNSITLGGNIATTALPASPANSTITDTITLDMILSATRSITTATRHNLDISGIISDSSAGFGITKAGPGALTLTGANTFGGLVTVNGGILNVNTIADSGSSALGFGALNLTTGQLTYNGAAAASTGRTITLAGSSTINNASPTSTSTLTLNGTFTTGTGGAKSITFAGGNTGANTVSSLLANASDGSLLTVIKNGGGAWALTNANNSFTGPLFLQQGTLTVNSIKDGGIASNIGAGTSIRFGNATSGGILLYTGAAQSTNRTVQIGNNSAAPVDTDTGGAVIQNDGGGLLTFSAPTFNTALDTATGTGANRVLTLRGSNDGKISGIIQNNTNSGGSGTTTIGVTKAEAGTWTLEGANTYSGATNVTGGTLTISGSRNVAAGVITVGGAVTTSVLNLQNTGSYSTGLITIGSAGSTSTVNQSAGTITAVSGNGIIMGNGGPATIATYALSGGSLTTAGVGIIMGTNTSSGAAHQTNFNLSGTGALTVSTLRIGRYDSAAYNTNNTFSQTGGTATVTTFGLGGRSADSALTNPIAAALNLTGGTFSANTFASLSAGGANTSTILIGGTAEVTLPAYSGAARGSSSTATITFDTTVGGGGFLAPQVASATYMPADTYNSAYLSINGANFKVASGKDITIGQVFEDKLGDAGKLTKSDAGMLTLSGASTYTGATIISGGTLALDATGTIDNTSSVSLGTVGIFDVSAKSNYTVSNLVGSGNVTGALTVSTQLAIGNSPGTVNFSTNLTLDSAAYVYEMTGGPAPGAGSADLGNVAATLTISAGSVLDLVELGTYTIGNKFTLFSYGTLSGTFDGLANNANFLDDLSNTWQIKYDDTIAGANGGTGANFITITAVPEPNAAMLAGGLGALAMLRRRRA